MLNTFKLLPKQKELIEVPHNHLTDVALYQGGVGSGKTTAGVILGYLLSTIYPNSRGLVGAATYSLLRDTTKERYKEIVPKSDIESWKTNPDNLRFKNGSEIWFRHLSDPGRLSSMEFNWIHIEEGSQIPVKSFYALLARLRYNSFTTINNSIKKRFRLFITSNPEENFGYLYNHFVQPDKPKENFRFIRAATDENHFLLKLKPDYIELIKQVVDEDYARLYLEGHSSNISSKTVYRNFDRQKDVGEDAQYDPALKLHISFDFNVDFMVALLIQESPANVTKVIGELVIRGGSDTNKICELFLQRYGDHVTGIAIHGDATGYARHHRGSMSDYDIIRQRLSHMPNFVIKVRPRSANPSIRDRTNAVNFRFANAYGERRMKLNPVCKYLIRSLERTRFYPDSFAKEKVRDPSDPRFINDHPGDALDYYMANEHPFKREALSLVPYM